MLIKIFEDVFVSADRIKEVQIKCDHKAGDYAVSVWLDDQRPDYDHPRTHYYDTEKGAREGATILMVRANRALRGG